MALAAGALLLVMMTAGPASASPGGTVEVHPAASTVPATVQVSGWCADPRPATTTVSLDGAQVSAASVDTTEGTWGPVTVHLGSGLAVGAHTLTTSCGGSATVAVTAPPAQATLSVTPASARLPVSVTLTGSCPAGTATVGLLVDGYDGGPLPITSSTGRITATTLDFGTDTPLGKHTLSTTCGGSAVFTALATPVPTTTPRPSTSAPRTSAPAPSTTPGTSLVQVPDLVGLTEQQAVHALGDQLQLARVTGTDRRISSQDPAAGATVPAGSVVSVTYAAAPGLLTRSSTAWITAAVVFGLLLVVLVAWAVSATRGGRRPPPGHGGGGGPAGGPAGGPDEPTRELVRVPGDDGA